MKKAAFFVFLLLVATVSAQNISNVDFQQVGDEILITYDLDESSPIGVYVSLDGGKSYEEVHSVRGDVGRVVLPGKKRILWKVLYDIPEGLAGQVQLKVSTNLFVSFDGVEFEMVYVKGGSFMMGASEHNFEADGDPVHSVTLSDYYIGKFEVTQGLWEKVMGTTIEQQIIRANSNYGCHYVNFNYPMVCVNWNEAWEFCKKLAQLTGKKYSLPTEAQWEYAARGGMKSKGYCYSGSNNADEVALYDDCAGNIAGNGFMDFVGTKQPNELGIYDMSGNVNEWCNDWYGSYSIDIQIDPMGPSSGSWRVLRGGSFLSEGEWECGVSKRFNNPPGARYCDIGFRIVCLP